MAKELLNSCEKLPSADIFSLGVVIFELSTLMLELPSEGEGWHDLRDGRIPRMDSPQRSAMLQQLVAKV
jgi:membrane-associated tyrosine/threonine-specific cdc2-inhibitory kinase